MGNIRVLESAQEITYRPVINGVEAEEERVFALRKDPLRFEMFCRSSKDEMRWIGKPPNPSAFPSSTQPLQRPSACDVRQAPARRRTFNICLQICDAVYLGSSLP